LNFGVKESPDEVSIGTVEMLTLEKVGIAFGILSLGGTEPEIHLGGHLPSQLQRTFKKYHCNTRVNNILTYVRKTDLCSLKKNRRVHLVFQAVDE